MKLVQSQCLTMQKTKWNHMWGNLHNTTSITYEDLVAPSDQTEAQYASDLHPEGDNGWSDDPEECNAIVNALSRAGDYRVSVGTRGNDRLITSWLTEADDSHDLGADMSMVYNNTNGAFRVIAMRSVSPRHLNWLKENCIGVIKNDN